MTYIVTYHHHHPVSTLAPRSAETDPVFLVFNNVFDDISSICKVDITTVSGEHKRPSLERVDLITNGACPEPGELVAEIPVLRTLDDFKRLVFRMDDNPIEVRIDSTSPLNHVVRP